MSEIQQQELTSLDIKQQQLENLKQIFPEVFTEGNHIDWEKLKFTLGENIEVGKERYGMNWPGKADCFKTIQQPSRATLVPDREESIDFDTTENLFIEGDNLEVLKLLQKSYLGKIKMIYIDPPYNTGKEFIYPDNYNESLDTYLEYTGQKDAEGRKYQANTDTDGRYHSKWLNMMYPRLFLAKNLMREDGVIFIHIDEHEYNNLIIMLNEIFGEENNLGTIVWDKRNPKGDAKGISVQHEYIVVFAKSEEVFKQHNTLKRPKKNATKILAKAKELISENGVNAETRKYFKEWLAKQDFSGGERAFNLIDENGKVFQTVSMAWPNKKKAPDDYFIPLRHPITGKECPVPQKGWRNPSKTMDKLIIENQIVFGQDESTQPRRKYLLEENLDENVPSLLYNGNSDDNFLKSLGIVFDNPKVTEVSKDLISSAVEENGIVLDFFAGSGTTAHAVLELNKLDNGNRKFICVQIPEPTIDNSEAKNAGFNAISDITKARIRKVSENVKRKLAEEKEQSKNQLFVETTEKKLDLGFKVFQLQPSNFKIWDSSLETKTEAIQAKLFDHIDHIPNEENQEAILYELLLKSGFELTTPIGKIDVAGKKVFTIAEGLLLICLEKEMTLECLKAMAEMQPTRVICLDEAFEGENADALKTNAVQIMKSKGVLNFRTV